MITAFIMLTTLIAEPVKAEKENVQIETPLALGSVNIPDALAPAVVPYLFCLNEAVNKGLAGLPDQGADAKEAQIIEKQALTACSVTRVNAATLANTLLAKSNGALSKEERASQIEATLNGIENMATSMSAKMDQMPTAAPNQEKSNAPNQ